MLACAFLARVLRIAGASLEGVLSGTQPASLRSYSRGSYKPTFTVVVKYVIHFLSRILVIPARDLSNTGGIVEEALEMTAFEITAVLQGAQGHNGC